MHEDKPATKCKESKTIFRVKYGIRKKITESSIEQIKWKKELKGFEDGLKADIHLELPRTTLKKVPNWKTLGQSWYKWILVLKIQVHPWQTGSLTEYVLTNPPARARCNTRSIFKQVFEARVFLLQDWLPNQGWRTQFAQLFTHGGRIIGFITFPRVLILCEMQLASSRIWTRVAVSIPYGNDHYTTSTSWLSRWLEEASILEWMTKEKITQIQKDLQNRMIPSNYRPIACLSMM